MEEELIEHVRSNPLLYDLNHREYRNHNARKECWDELGEKLGVSGNVCKENWNKLRNAYTQALKRRSMQGQAGKNLGKWKFEEQLAFLSPTLELRQNRGNAEKSDDGTEDDAILSPDEEVNSQLVPSPPKWVKIGAHFQVGSQLNQSENNTKLPINTIPNVGPSMLSESNLSPITPHHFAKPDKRAGVARKRLESSVEQMVTLIKDNTRLRSECLLRNPQSAAQSDLYDECDLFFLSMAKTVKKLRRADQFKVKMDVSEIVFRAELRAAQNDPLLVENTSVEYRPTSSHYSTATTPPQHSTASSPRQSFQSGDDSSSHSPDESANE